MITIAQLNDIYDSIPEVSCLRPCADCCGLQPIAPIEMENILLWAKTHTIRIASMSIRMLDCAFLVDYECSIYPVRPLTCRLYPVVNHPAMFCEHGVKPNKFLTQAETNKMIEAVFQKERRNV